MKNKKLAILMLACKDYEATELALACHMYYGNPNIPFFILQNCRGSYDAERTLQVAKRYQTLYPNQIKVIDSIGPDYPYKSISELLDSDTFKEFDLVCKVDDDAFPVSPGWIDSLLSLWDEKVKEHGDRLAYVTPLINNNCWGFSETLKAMGLEKTYFERYARDHYAGAGANRKLYPADTIATGSDGTVWQLPYLARWIHEETTLQPDRFVAATKELTPAEVPSQERYSIGCILFRKDFWSAINDGGRDDEHMMHQYCKKKNLLIFCQRSVPFAHMAYFVQREENRDIVEAAQKVYQERLSLPYPISLRKTRALEIEARLRWIESSNAASNDPNQMAATCGGASPNLSPEEFGVRAFKGVVRAILYKLKLSSRRP
ncbi:hypothetical protein [Brucella anthropi]|uniref:hypothetical protein n=1 Tax=Brucella anthropi TaxID=529 RepID=UPI0007751E04|nr:hypothetical protein [Brucella anthropi]KXO74292.1 hypothetical protein AYJ56_12170 [Brucella anthropi]